MRSGRVTRDPTRSRTLGAAGVLAVTAIVAFVAFTSSVQGLPQVDPPEFAGMSPPPMTAPPAASAAPVAPPPPQATDPAVAGVIQLVLAVIVLAGVLAVLLWLTRRLVLWLRERRVHARSGVVVSAEVAGTADTVPDAGVVRRGIAAALAQLDGRREPGDAVVAAWLGLEESAAETGLQRASTETAGEFVTRIVARGPAVGPDVAALLRLYEDVRFGERSIGTAELRTARAALERIEAAWS